MILILSCSENEMLRKEVVQLRRRSRQQEHVLNKVKNINIGPLILITVHHQVIHFIAHMIYQGRLPNKAVPRKR